MPSVRESLRRLPRVARFGLSGVAVAVVNIGAMTVLLAVIDLPVQLSLVFSYALALAVHFTLNRHWVFWTEGAYHLHLTAQGTRYLACALTIYGATALSLATLPGPLGLDALVVYYAASVVLAFANFFVLRTFVFRAAG
jgi:putative flippase GtrA